MRRVRALEAAAIEAGAAVRWYEAQRPGLGEEFERALAAALAQLQQQIVPLHALSGAPAPANTQRLTMKRFPFDIVVAIADDEVIIVALAHHARRPGYWRGRVVR